MSKAPDETWKIAIDLATKDGLPIDLYYNTNVEFPNRGYVCDEITAFVDGKTAGYLKVQNIPASNIPIFYPSGPLSYAFHIVGQSIFPYDIESQSPIDIKTASLDILNSTLRRLQDYSVRTELPRDFQFSSRDEFDHWFKKVLMKSHWYKDTEKGFKRFCEFNVDKPFVAYASTRRPNRGLEEESFEGRGVARAMYIAMALELEKQGLMLRRSATLFAGAVRLWKSFQRDDVTVPGLVTEDGIQPILSPDKIRAKLGISLREDFGPRI